MLPSSRFQIPKVIRQKAVWFSVVVGIWGVVTFLTAIQGYVAAQVTGNPQTFGRLFMTSVPWYGAWALLTPGVVWVASRTDFKFRHTARFVAIHLAAGLATVFGQAILYVSMATYANRANPNFPTVPDLMALKLSGSIHINLMIYAIIVALVVAGRAYADLREKEMAAARLKSQLAEAEIMALRAQLQPHFLFNTLNAISALVGDDPVRARRLVARLGDLLRMSLAQERRHECPLADELAFTDAYLAIEGERLGDRLRIVREVDPETLGVKVPALMLQTLVENAVQHGIAPVLRGGILTLRAELTETHLLVRISDDGCGAARVVEGVGLRNTRERLRQLYGDRHVFEIETSPDQGFRVTVKVPHDT